MQTVFPAHEKKARLRSKEQLSDSPSPPVMIHLSQAAHLAGPFPLCSYSCDVWQKLLHAFFSGFALDLLL